MQCPNCDNEIPPGFKFCGHCGTSLADVADVADAADAADGADVNVEAPTTSAPVAESPAVGPSTDMPTREERRYVAVLFADVSGFTSMSHDLDPEDVHALMNECLAGLGRAIRDEDGYIDKYIGDCVMGVFGAPIAHEDDAIRACRAALAMQAFIRTFSARTRSERSRSRLSDSGKGEPGQSEASELRARIGVNYGLVVAGNVGHGSDAQYTVMGDVVNVASRLEAAAPTGTILVSDSIESQANHRFEFGDAQAISVKGKPEPITAHELLAPLERERGRERERDARSPHLVGRRRHLAAMAQWLERTQTGGGWMEILGEHGLGKTRLVREAALRARDRRFLNVSSTTTTLLEPFALARRTMHEIVIELTGDSGCLSQPQSFSAMLHDLDPGLRPFEKSLWYLAATTADPVPPPDPDPHSLRRTIERGVEALLAAFARRRPEAVLFLDGYEMVDEASAALFGRMAGAGGPPVPTVVAARRHHADDARDAETRLVVEPLTPPEAEELLACLVRGAELPDDLRRQILERADGVPLFMEEMVGVLIASDSLKAGRAEDDWTFIPERGTIEMPPTLHAAMISRLDRLDLPARELLSQCAVQGIEFCLDCAEWVRREEPWAGPPVPPLIDGLQGVRMIGEPASGSLARRRVFARTLMQQAAYETMLQRSRRALHARIADALVDLAAGDVRAVSEVLAFHEERAERWGRAAAANLAAGDNASDLFLNDQALARYERVVSHVDRCDQKTDDLRCLAARACCGAARVHLRLGAYEAAAASAAAVDAMDAALVERAESMRLRAAVGAATGRTDEAVALLEDMVERLGSDHDIGSDVLSEARHDLAHLHYRAGRLDEASRELERSRSAPTSRRDLANVRADLLEGRILQTRGAFEDARAAYLRARDAADDLGSLSVSGEVSNRLGSVARDEGEYETASKCYERALVEWGRTGDVERIAGAHNNIGNVGMSVGDLDTAAEHFELALTAWREIGHERGTALALVNLGLMKLERGDPEAATAYADRSLEAIGDAADDLLRGLVLVVLGEGHHGAGRSEDARRCFDSVLADFTADDHPLAIAGAERGLGRLELEAGDTTAAIEWLRRARDRFAALTRTQEHARTQARLAEALHAASRPDDAREEIDAAIAAFEAMGADRDAAVAREIARAIG